MAKQQQGKSRRMRGKRRICVRSVQRDTPDLRKLGRALIAFAVAQAEAEAKQQDVGEKAAQTKDREVIDD